MSTKLDDEHWVHLKKLLDIPGSKLILEASKVEFVGNNEAKAAAVSEFDTLRKLGVEISFADPTEPTAVVVPGLMLTPDGKPIYPPSPVAFQKVNISEGKLQDTVEDSDDTQSN